MITMSTERTPQSLQPHPDNPDIASKSVRESYESHGPSIVREREPGGRQIAEQHGHMYGSIAVSGSATAVLGDKNGNEYYHNNTFHINQAHFILTNVSAISPNAEEVAAYQTLECHPSEHSPYDQKRQANDKTVKESAGVWLVPFERTDTLVERSHEVEILMKRIGDIESRSRAAITGLGV